VPPCCNGCTGSCATEISSDLLKYAYEILIYFQKDAFHNNNSGNWRNNNTGAGGYNNNCSGGGRCQRNRIRGSQQWPWKREPAAAGSANKLIAKRTTIAAAVAEGAAATTSGAATATAAAATCNTKLFQRHGQHGQRQCGKEARRNSRLSCHRRLEVPAKIRK